MAAIMNVMAVSQHVRKILADMAFDVCDGLPCWGANAQRLRNRMSSLSGNGFLLNAECYRAKAHRLEGARRCLWIRG